MIRSALPDAPPLDARSLRTVCGHYPTGVTVVTACDSAGALAAVTVNAFVPVSQEDRMVAVCIGKNVSSAPLLADADRMSIHVLHGDQRDLASRVATSGLSGEERLAGSPWGFSAAGTPRLEEYSSRMAGTVVDRWSGGDHIVYLIAVDDVDVTDSVPDALGFYQGRFVRLVPDGDAPLAEATASEAERG